MNDETIYRAIAGVGDRIFVEVLTIGEILLSRHLVDVFLLSVTPGYDYNQVGTDCVSVILEDFQIPRYNFNTIIAVAMISFSG